MKVTAKTDAFLANTEKKKRFIAMLRRHLSESEGRAWPAVCRNMFFLHAILGCDTTSRPYGTGKAASLKRMLNLSTSKINYSTSRDQLKPRLRQRERML